MIDVKKRGLDVPDPPLCNNCVFVEREKWEPPCKDCKDLPGNSHKTISYFSPNFSPRK